MPTFIDLYPSASPGESLKIRERIARPELVKGFSAFPEYDQEVVTRVLLGFFYFPFRLKYPLWAVCERLGHCPGHSSRWCPCNGQVAFRAFSTMLVAGREN